MLAGLLCTFCAASVSDCPDEMPPGEQARLPVYKRNVGEWPPKTFGGNELLNPPGWNEHMLKKEEDIMKIENVQWRWDRWLEQVQIRTLPNFTTKGWEVAKMDDDVHADMASNFLKEHVCEDDGKPRTKSCSTNYNSDSSTGFIAGKSFVLQVDKDMEERIVNQARKKISAWTGVAEDDLEATSFHPTRIYYNESTLITHVDQVATHVLSAVYVVAADYDAEGNEAWLMKTDPDFEGNHVQTKILPGELFLYESAKLPHGRPEPLKATYSAHIFIHFRPKGWEYSNMDRVYAVPPNWDAGARVMHEEMR